MRIEVTQLPPFSSSSNWRGFWAQRYKEASTYRDAVFYECVAARNRAYSHGEAFPYLKARLNLTFVFATYRHRDQDNLRTRFIPGQNAIVSAALICDDDSEHLILGDIQIVVDPDRAPLTIIELEEVKDEGISQDRHRE